MFPPEDFDQDGYEKFMQDIPDFLDITDTTGEAELDYNGPVLPDIPLVQKIDFKKNKKTLVIRGENGDITVGVR